MTVHDTFMYLYIYTIGYYKRFAANLQTTFMKNFQ